MNNVTTSKAQVGPNKFVTSSFERDANENIVKTVEPEGNFHIAEYDERNLIYRQIQGADTPAEQQVTNFAYNENAGLVKVTYGDGITTKGAVSNYYDNFDRLQKTMDETGNYTEFIRDTAGLLRETRRVDSTGKVLLHDKVDYDESGRPFQTQHLVDDPVTMTSDWTVSLTYYDRSGRTDKTVDAKGREFQYKWDGLGRLIATLDTLGNKTLTEYDENSNPVTMTQTEVDPQTGAQETFTSRNVYDPLDRLYQAIDNAGNSSEVKYDGRDNVVWSKDREGNTITRKYDGLSRMTDTMYQMRQGGTGNGIIEKEITVSNVFDNNSRLIQKKDGKGNISSYAYDSVNRMKTETLPDATQKGYFFRPEGVLHHSIDANGTQVTYGYDNALRMIHKDIQRGTGVEGVTSEDYWYDGANRMTLAQNDYSTVTRKYNSYSEVYEETSAVTVNGATQTKTVSSEFDRMGNRTALIYPSGKKLNYTRDELNRTKNILDEYGKPVTQYAYNGYRVKQRKSGNGTQLDIAYDAMRRITQYTNTKTAVPPNGTQEIAGFEYGYNKEGMRTYENYFPGDSETNQNARAKVVTYDSLYQISGVKYDIPDPLAEINQTGSQSYSKQISYQVDNSGSRENVTTTQFGQSSVTQNYQTNSLNQYTSIDSSVFSYDNVGNMKTGVVYLDDLENPGQKTPVLVSFVYDYNNKLLKVEQQNDNKVLGAYQYDVMGRRIWKNAWSRNAQMYEGTCFWYDGVECLEETDSTGTVIARYVFGLGIDEVISVEFPQSSLQYPQTGIYWYHTDALGSIVAVTDSNSNVAERYKYDIYGETAILEPDSQFVRVASVLGNRIRYTGREYDSETGLYYSRSRHYLPQMGRFISSDIIGINFLGNLYAYVDNNPLNYFDPFGYGEETVFHRTTSESATKILEEGFKGDYTYFSTDETFSVTKGASGPAFAEKDVVFKTTLNITKENTLAVDYKTWHNKYDEIYNELESKVTSELTDEVKTALHNEAQFTRQEYFLSQLEKEGKQVLKFETVQGKAYNYAVKGGSKSGVIKSKATKIIGKLKGKAFSEAKNVPAELKAAARAKFGAKALKYIKIGGKIVVFVGVGLDIYEVYTSENKAKTIVTKVGGWGSATACGAVALKLTAGCAATFWGAVVTGVATVGAGAVGYFVGEEVTETIYEWSFE